MRAFTIFVQTFFSRGDIEEQIEQAKSSLEQNRFQEAASLLNRLKSNHDNPYVRG